LDEIADSKTIPVPGGLFGDPEEYEKMSMEEREKLTAQMKRSHKSWAKQPLHPKGKTKWV